MPAHPSFLARLSSLFRPQPLTSQRVQLDEAENEFLVGASSLTPTDFDRDQYSREESSPNASTPGASTPSPAASPKSP
jgi:hypothetical protein